MMDEAFWTGASQMDALDTALANMPATVTAPAATGLYHENCPKCHGTGQFRGYSGRSVGRCFTCKGTGKLTFKTSAHDRDNARSAAAKRALDNAALSVEGFEAEHPEVYAWLVAAAGRGFNFAASLLQAVTKYGYLTEKQMEAAERLVREDAERASVKAADAAARVAQAPTMDQDKLYAAFAAALGNGLKRPQLRFEGFTAYPAKPEGANPGAIYIKAGGDYLGKITGGRFMASRDCADPQRVAGAVTEAMQDPLAAALAYGRSTGSCSCCGRLLTDPESVAAGIGPVCATKFGF